MGLRPNRPASRLPSRSKAFVRALCYRLNVGRNSSQVMVGPAPRGPLLDAESKGPNLLNNLAFEIELPIYGRSLATLNPARLE